MQMYKSSSESSWVYYTKKEGLKVAKSDEEDKSTERTYKRWGCRDGLWILWWIFRGIKRKVGKFNSSGKSGTSLRRNKGVLLHFLVINSFKGWLTYRGYITIFCQTYIYIYIWVDLDSNLRLDLSLIKFKFKIYLN